MVDLLDISNYRDKYKSFYDKLFFYDLGNVNIIRRGEKTLVFVQQDSAMITKRMNVVK